MELLCTSAFFLFRPRVCSFARGSWTRREHARTPRRTCGPWPRSVAHALGVKVESNHGEAFEHIEPSRPMRTHLRCRLTKCPTAGVVFRMLWHLLRCWMSPLSSEHTWWFKVVSPTPTCARCDHFSTKSYNLHGWARKDSARSCMEDIYHHSLDGCAFTCGRQLFEHNNNVQSK